MWLAGTLAHDLVQDGFAGLAERWGTDGLTFRLSAITLLVGGPAILATTFTSALWHGRVGLRAWGLWILAATAATFVLTQTRAELVHFPQYALVAVLLLRIPLAPTAALGAACLLGGLDEAWQSVFLYPERLLDWNDIVLNALGATLGLLAAWSWRGQLNGFWVIGLDGVRFHPMSAWEGVVAVAAIIAAFHFGVARRSA